MQENTLSKPNKRANMAFQTRPRTIRSRAVLPLALLGVLPAGCARPFPPAQPLVGHWRGVTAAGDAAVPSAWEIRSDGTQSVTLTLPQGTMTAEGTWTTQAGLLTERTTIRAMTLGAEQRTVVLAGPMETTFAYRLQGDTLTLTRPDTHQRIVLTREADAAGE